MSFTLNSNTIFIAYLYVGIIFRFLVRNIVATTS